VPLPQEKREYAKTSQSQRRGYLESQGFIFFKIDIH
jgi:hypothetical protein